MTQPRECDDSGSDARQRLSEAESGFVPTPHSKLSARPPQSGRDGPYGPSRPPAQLSESATMQPLTDSDESIEQLGNSINRLFANTYVRDPRFPSPPRHHSPDAIPQPRIPPLDRGSYVRPAIINPYSDLYTPRYHHTAHLVSSMSTFASDLTYALEDAEPHSPGDDGSPAVAASSKPYWESPRLRTVRKTVAPYLSTEENESGEGPYERAQRTRNQREKEKQRIKLGVVPYSSVE